MKVAISADFHLINKEKTPERFNALCFILNKLKEKKINTFIIAGDLFDKNFSNLSDFEKLIDKFGEIEIIIVPGNHDKNLKFNQIRNKNVKVIENSFIKKIGNTDFLLMPFLENSTMDEELEKFKNELKESWVLIGHGDFITYNKAVNPYEKGTYMVLSEKKIREMSPRYVILGHIHKPITFREKVYYVGSPCGIDKSEKGKKSFIILDTENLTLKREYIKTDIIFLEDNILIYPTDNEVSFLKNEITKMLEKWELEEDETEKVDLKLNILGFTTNKRKIIEALKSILLEKGIKKFEIEDSELNFYENGYGKNTKIKLFKEIEKKTKELNFDENLKMEILKNSIKTIFGGNS